jgi:hypothetical protein
MKNMNPLIHLKKATPSFVAPFVQKRRTTVKRIFSLLFVLAVVVVTTTSTVHAQCSNATLTGSYGFKQQGFGLRNSKPAKLGNMIPFATVGVVTFDGAGNASFTLTQVFNSEGGAFFEAIPGTYTVNSDCTGTIAIEDFGLHFYMVTVGGGAEVFAIQTETGTTNIVDAKKQ